jgi:hypothetical protein
MSKVVYFKPLDDCGLVPVDLHACRFFPVFQQDHDHPDFPGGGVVSQAIYRTADEKHWFEHVETFDPWESDHHGDSYEEVTPWYAAQELGEAGRKIPCALEPYWRAIQEYRKASPWGSGKLLGQRDNPGIPFAGIDPAEDHPESFSEFLESSVREANDRLRNLLTQYGVELGEGVSPVLTTTYHVANHLLKIRGIRSTLDAEVARNPVEHALLLNGEK